MEHSRRQSKIINLRPPEISAAWERGDIDAAYVWEPALSKAKASGTVLTDSKQVGEWGAPTYDLWVVRKDFAEKNPDFLKALSKPHLSNSKNITKTQPLTLKMLITCKKLRSSQVLMQKISRFY